MLAALLLSALLTGCFEEPVRETLHLVFHQDGRVEVTARTRLSAYHLERGHPRLQLRLRQRQRALVEGWDRWPLRFDVARPAEETTLLRREEGELLEVERFAVLDEPDAVGRFFSDHLTAVYRVSPADAEVAFYPTSGVRATGGERQQVERALDGWSEALARHIEATAALYRYLEAHPERARPTMRGVFGQVDEGDPEAALTAREDSLVRSVRRSMEAVTAVLEVPDDDAWSLNELARKVYDPFPALLTLEVPGEVTEVEGFAQRNGAWSVPGLDLWRTVRALEGRWIAPDPVVALVDAELAYRSVDVDDWLTTGRRVAATPDPGAVRTAVEESLAAEPVYRLRWSPGS